MIYLLDTNTCIVYLNGQNLRLKRKLEGYLNRDMAICSVVKAELFYGSSKSKNPAKNLARQKGFLKRFTSLPFDVQAAEIYGTIRADLERKGTPIGVYDLQIAAIALANRLILVHSQYRGV